MKKIVTVIIVILAILFVGWMLFGTEGKQTQEVIEGTNGEPPIISVTSQGEITEIDSGQVAVDGPYVIVMSPESSDDEVTIHVPSMGRNLCATGDIADVSSLSVGDTIRVRGSRNAEGAIVPCEDRSHFLRVVQALEEGNDVETEVEADITL